MAGQLVGERRVELLRGLDGQAADEPLDGEVVVQLVGGELGLGEGKGLPPGPARVVALDES